MADPNDPVDPQPAPSVFRAPSEETNHEQEVELDREEYIHQLQTELQDLREEVQELKRQRAQPMFTAAPNAASAQSAPPGFPMPQSGFGMTGAGPSVGPPPNYYPYPSPMQGMYPYPPPPLPQPEVKKKCTFKQFLDCKPPDYSGSPNPTITLNWLWEVDRALDACQCEPELRVIYASRLLKGDAMVWWDSLISNVPKEQVNAVPWEQFYAKVCEQYCTSYEINRIKREFMELQMTDQMTVDELIVKFNEKLRFVQSWVPDEQSRVQHFIDALAPDYRMMVRSATSLPQAFVMAKMAESDVKASIAKRRERFTQQKSSGGQSSGSSWSKNKKQFRGAGKAPQTSASGTGSDNKPMWCIRCRAAHVGECSAQTRRCLRCGVIGHDADNCTFKTNVCWSCQKEGHRSAQCPERRKGSSGVSISGSGSRVGSASASTASTGQKRKNPPPPEGRAFQMTVEEATATDDVITGMFLVNSTPARVLLYICSFL